MKSLLERLNALLLLALFCTTIAAVVLRTVLGLPASWSEELGQYGFIFLVFIGAAAAVADDSHIAITSLADRLGPRGRLACKLLQCILPLPFLIVFAWGAWLNVQANWGTELSTVPWMNVGYMYLCVTLSSVAMCGWLIQRGVRLLRTPPRPSALSR